MNLDANDLLFVVLFLLYIYPTIPYDLAPLYLVLLSCGSPQLPSFSVIPTDTFGHFSLVLLSAALLPPSPWPACTRKCITHGKRCRIRAGSDPLPQNSNHSLLRQLTPTTSEGTMQNVLQHQRYTNSPESLSKLEQ